MHLTGNVILITGGATGIGLALARQLSERGNRVIICGRSEEALVRAQAELPHLIIRVCDISKRESRQAMVEWLNAAHLDLNVVVNNAGVQSRRDFRQGQAVEGLDQEVAINFTAPIHLIAELMPLLSKQPQGVIANVSSGLAFSPMADVPVYCATKAALHSFTLSLRHQLKASRIRVVEIVPPIVNTGLGGRVRSGGVRHQTMLSPDEFATEALRQLEADQDEVLVGTSINTRRLGETLFERMNGAPPLDAPAAH